MNALYLVVVALAVPVGTAFAHDPIIFTDTQTTPEAGPLLLDGTVSFAIDRGEQVMRPSDRIGTHCFLPTIETRIIG